MARGDNSNGRTGKKAVPGTPARCEFSGRHECYIVSATGQRCQSSFDSEKELLDHLVADHKAARGSKGEDGKLVCRWQGCDASVTQLSRHYISHAEYRGHVCGECGHSAATKEQLVTHARGHGERQLRCNQCQQLFRTRDALTQHRRRVHFKHPEGNFPCEMGGCVVRDNDRSNLRKHANKQHPREGAVECPFDGCDYRDVAFDAGRGKPKGMWAHIEAFHPGHQLRQDATRSSFNTAFSQAQAREPQVQAQQVPAPDQQPGDAMLFEDAAGPYFDAAQELAADTAAFSAAFSRATAGHPHCQAQQAPAPDQHFGGAPIFGQRQAFDNAAFPVAGSSTASDQPVPQQALPIMAEGANSDGLLPEFWQDFPGRDVVEEHVEDEHAGDDFFGEFIDCTGCE